MASDLADFVFFVKTNAAFENCRSIETLDA